MALVDYKMYVSLLRAVHVAAPPRFSGWAMQYGHSTIISQATHWPTRISCITAQASVCITLQLLSCVLTHSGFLQCVHRVMDYHGQKLLSVLASLDTVFFFVIIIVFFSPVWAVGVAALFVQVVTQRDAVNDTVRHPRRCKVMVTSISHTSSECTFEGIVCLILVTHRAEGFSRRCASSIFLWFDARLSRGRCRSATFLRGYGESAVRWYFVQVTPGSHCTTLRGNRGTTRTLMVFV